MTHLHQLTLEELARSRKRDPSTSKAAARRAGGLASEHQRRILEVMRRGGDWTPEEIATACGLTSVQVSRRIHELAGPNIAAIVLAGTERPTATGRMARCWRALP